MPQFVHINERLVPIGTRDYQALQMSWDKRLSQGVHCPVDYTGSRNIERDHRRSTRARRRSRKSPTRTGRTCCASPAAGSLPGVRSGNGRWSGSLLGGWQINASTFFRSGLTCRMPDNVDLIGDPVLANPTSSALVQHLHADGGGRAAELRHDPTSSRRSGSVPTTRSTPPARGSRTSIAATRWILDMSFFKTFQLTSRFNFQTRVEMFNLTNAVQWPAANTNVTSTAFGTVAETQSNDPRFVQIAFRLIF